MVIDVLDAVAQRQASIYESGGGFAQTWASARRFYQKELESGFVRLRAELWTASLSNSGLREKFLPRLLAWKNLVSGASQGAADKRVRPPPARALGADRRPVARAWRVLVPDAAPLIFTPTSFS